VAKKVICSAAYDCEKKTCEHWAVHTREPYCADTECDHALFNVRCVGVGSKEGKSILAAMKEKAK
jgi:hypothetical protein